jgi:hypothetical protein
MAGIIGRHFFSKRLIAFELLTFLFFIALIWITELIDIPFLLLGAEASPINWRESLFETLIILPLALAIVYCTRKVFSRMKYLEGLLPVCSNCKKICDDQGNWQQMESYIQKHSEARFSHGICPHCAHTKYPEVFSKPK